MFLTSSVFGAWGGAREVLPQESAIIHPQSQLPTESNLFPYVPYTTEGPGLETKTRMLFIILPNSVLQRKYFIISLGSVPITYNLPEQVISLNETLQKSLNQKFNGNKQKFFNKPS